MCHQSCLCHRSKSIQIVIRDPKRMLYPQGYSQSTFQCVLYRCCLLHYRFRSYRTLPAIPKLHHNQIPRKMLKHQLYHIKKPNPTSFNNSFLLLKEGKHQKCRYTLCYIQSIYISMHHACCCFRNVYLTRPFDASGFERSTIRATNRTVLRSFRSGVNKVCIQSTTRQL